ncbi:hypothetical protein WJX84_005023 [Apatococcus fuscideae]|uniref:Inhibitor of growth protein N-terminal histone-binding domain-containing protein n=1 Tax=Apatococcus fuscideae TaxID=2026836 RepID=A0AAW1SPA1_9CHLO
MQSNTLHLENCVEAVAGVPPEVRRLVQTIHELDARCEELKDRLRQRVQVCLDKPSAGNPKANAEAIEEVNEMRLSIAADQQRLCQWSEEKVALACNCCDLLDWHSQKLTREIRAFDSELKAENALKLEYVELPGPSPEELKRQRLKEMEVERGRQETRKRERDVVDPDKKASAVVAEPMEEVGLGSAPATPADGFAVPPPRVPARSSLLSSKAAGDRVRQSPEQLPGHMPKRKAAQRAGQAAASLMAAENGRDEDGNPLPAALPGADGLYVEMPGLVPEGAEGSAPINFTRQIPDGMKQSADNPQAVGRLLTHEDIGPALKGRQAELFWPDDNLWYLIEISDVNLEMHKAQIIYWTGETEELDLEEIVKEGHMSLILDQKS